MPTRHTAESHYGTILWYKGFFAAIPKDAVGQSWGGEKAFESAARVARDGAIQETGGGISTIHTQIQIPSDQAVH
jgi:hypothetical protein